MENIDKNCFFISRRNLVPVAFSFLSFFVTSLFLFGFFHDRGTYPSLASTILIGGIVIVGLVGAYIFWMELFVVLNTAVLTAALAGNIYHGQLSSLQHSFLLKYFLSSQCLIGWMLVMFVMATIVHWFDLIRRSGISRTKYTWWAVGCGLSGLLVRWYESYLMGRDFGHVPLSNLYEVFIVFMVFTALVALWYEKKLAIINLGALVLPVVVVAGAFMVWYGVTRKAYLILPLVPSLQSYWMKIHVPANFIGYGCFSAASTVGVAWLLKDGDYLVFLPSLARLEILMHSLISTGFFFFTLATILGALWAADAWGSYWQWDPKETWALIVWLNYAAWLHARFINNLPQRILAWWAIIGLFVTLFAFLGVNILLSGLHSYGQL